MFYKVQSRYGMFHSALLTLFQESQSPESESNDTLLNYRDTKKLPLEHQSEPPWLYLTSVAVPAPMIIIVPLTSRVWQPCAP